MSLQKETRIYKRFLISTCLATALCMSGIFLGIFIRTNSLIHEEFLTRARAQFDGIQLTREWNACYGGVYVEKKEGVVSNPFLADPDITTTDGKVYTKKKSRADDPGDFGACPKAREISLSHHQPGPPESRQWAG